MASSKFNPEPPNAKEASSSATSVGAGGGLEGDMTNDPAARNMDIEEEGFSSISSSSVRRPTRSSSEDAQLVSVSMACTIGTLWHLRGFDDGFL